jgi:hypothetical protein
MPTPKSWPRFHSTAQTHDPAARKLANRNHMTLAGAHHAAGPHRPGRGWLYEFYASMGRLDIYYRLFPGG